MKLAVCCLSTALLTSAVASEVKLVWDPNPPEDQVKAYVVYDRVGSNVVRLAVVYTNSVVLKDLAPGPHCFAVTATNAFGESGYSSEACAQLPGGSLQDPNDAVAPTSTVAPLPAESYLFFPVSWSGQDESGGSGLVSFDLYVSENNAPYSLWLKGVTSRQEFFLGNYGHAYSFFALATDLAGNKNHFPPQPQAQTKVALINTSPVLEPVPVLTAMVGDVLIVTNRAYDLDLPLQKLRFELGPDSLRNAMVHPETGLLYWKACLEHAGRTVGLEVNVFDDGFPNMSQSHRITIRVEDYAEIRFGTNILETGQTGRLPVVLYSSVPMDDVVFLLRIPSTHVSSLAFEPASQEVCDRLIFPESDSFWAVWFKLCGSLREAGTRQIGFLTLETVPESSGFVPIQCLAPTAFRSNGTAFPKVGHCDGRAVLITEAPLLELVLEGPERGSLMLYGMAGVPYLIESRPTFAPSWVPWQFFQAVTMPGMVQVLDHLTFDRSLEFFRARIDPDYIPARR